MGNMTRAIAAIQVCMLAVVTSVARAEPPAEGTRARLHLAADEAFKDGRFADARDAFLAIWEATGEREPACNVGRLSFRIGDMPRAVEFLGVCISTAPEGTKGLEDVRAELAQARAKVAEVRVRATAGTDVLVDGASRGRAPLVVYLPPGPHAIEGRSRAGSTERTIATAPGEIQIIDLQPEPEKVAPRRASGWIIASGAAGSAVMVGLGAVLAVTADRAESTADQDITGRNGCFTLNHPSCRSADRSYDAMVTMRDVSRVGFIAGASVATATLAYLLVPRGAVQVSARIGTGLQVEAVW